MGDDGRSRKRRKTDDSATKADAVQYHCNYCRKDITYAVRISCAICSEFDLCIECFSVGVELEQHKNNHDFRIMVRMMTNADNMHFPFITEDWCADEEQLLLEGLELYGYGNWEDVAEYVTTKDKKQCEEHYKTVYEKSPKWPEPDLDNVKTDREMVMRLNAGRGKIAIPTPAPGVGTGKKDTPRAPASQPVKPEFANFMPLRGEFEVEWDNDAEMQIKDLELTEEDSAEDRQNKIRLLQIYNIKLHEREERRKFVIERELHHVKKQQRLEKNRTKEEKELISKAVINERSLRQRIAELQDCRSNGCRSLQEAEVYKREVKRREAEKGRWNANKGGTRGKGWDGTATKKLQPGYELLSDIEKEIIAQLKLSPEKYIQAKEAILKEALLTGKVNRADAGSITKMDSTKAVHLIEFLEGSGWVNRFTPSQPPQPPPGTPLTQQQLQQQQFIRSLSGPAMPPQYRNLPNGMLPKHGMLSLPQMAANMMNRPGAPGRPMPHGMNPQMQGMMRPNMPPQMTGRPH